MSYKEEFNLLKYSYLNKMLYLSISNDQTWFLESLQKSDYFTVTSNDESRAYMFFVSMYLYYVICCDKDINSEKNNNSIFSKINGFLYNENDFDRSWLSNFKYLFNCLNKNSAFKMIKYLLNFKKGELLYEFTYKSKTKNNYANSEIFNDDLIIKLWLELVFSSHNINSFNKEEALNTLKNLKPYQLENLKNIFKYQIFQNDELNFKLNNPSFLSIFEIYKNADDNEPIINLFKELIGKESKNDNQVEESNNELKININLSKKLIDKFNQKLEELNICNEINDYAFKNKKEKDLCYKTKNIIRKRIIDKNILENNFDKRTKDLVNELFFYFNKYVNKFYNKNIVKNVKKFNDYDNFSSSKYLRSLNVDTDIKEYSKIKNVETCKIWINDNLIWEKDGISINIKCDEKNTLIRDLSDEEIENFINEKYSLRNGLYRINDNPEFDGAFISKEKLFEIIKNNYVIVTVAYTYCLKFNKNKIFKLK